jgi:hypothetical protein
VLAIGRHLAKIARMFIHRLLATAVAGAIALSCTPSTPKFAFKHAERRGRLESNGLRFVIMPDETTQLAQVDIRYDVGAREDPPGRAGLAHLVEHMMFQTRPDGPNTPPIFQTILDLATSSPSVRRHPSRTWRRLSARFGRELRHPRWPRPRPPVALR